MADNKPIQLGIIGCGLAVKWLHWPALKKLAGKYEIVAACDVDQNAAQETAKLAADELHSSNCSWTIDYREVLANADIEAVLISLPIHLNAQLVLESARAGKHILVEKPIASNLGQGQELVATLRHFAQLKIEVAENYRYRGDFQKAREWMDAGRIGEPFLIEMTARFWSDTSKGFASTPWRHDSQYRGGSVTDAGVHHVAGLRELGGDVEQLQAYMRSVHPVMRGYDTMVLNLRFRNTILGNMVFAGAVKTIENDFVQARVFGTDGAIKVSNGKVILSEGANDAAHIVEEYQVPDFDNGYKAEFENFYEAIRNDQPIVATVEQSLADLAVLMHAYDSSESRNVVLLWP